jgi:hypothetical protein
MQRFCKPQKSAQIRQEAPDFVDEGEVDSPQAVNLL